MISIDDKTGCCGCSACMSACPHDCITMKEDSEGFAYPVVDLVSCVDCGLCENVCPMLDVKCDSTRVDAYAFRSENHERESSSGGMFSVLADEVLRRKGVVYGAAFDEQLTVKHVGVESEYDMRALRGSRYLQSDMGNVFCELEDCLRDGRRMVLFSGTPCQVAGLKKFLGRDYESLLTVDVACHGVPSPLLWRKYVESMEEKVGRKLRSVNFRDKKRSWRNYDVTYFFDGYVKRVKRNEDPYMMLFLQNMSIRPSCYGCPFRCNSFSGDISLGDLWNVEEAKPEMNDDRGVSVVLANTMKGKEFLSEVMGDGGENILYPVTYSQAVARNGGFSGVYDVPSGRKSFFEGFPVADNLLSYMNRFVIKKSRLHTLYAEVHSLLSKIKNIVK